MREIRFRAWDHVNNRIISNPLLPTLPRQLNDYLNDVVGWEWMQFTGLKDKNGKEIYEGDIIEHLDQKHFEVVWSTKGQWLVKQIGSVLSIQLGILMSWKIEVIGNIHQNPELIKQ